MSYESSSASHEVAVFVFGGLNTTAVPNASFYNMTGLRKLAVSGQLLNGKAVFVALAGAQPGYRFNLTLGYMPFPVQWAPASAPGMVVTLDTASRSVAVEGLDETHTLLLWPAGERQPEPIIRAVPGEPNEYNWWGGTRPL
jgi:hypothetical protein